MPIPTPLMTLQKTTSNFWTSIDRRYLLLAAISFAIITPSFTGSISAKSFENSPAIWPMIVIFGVAPLLFVWAIVRLVVTYGAQASSPLPPTHVDRFMLVQSRSLTEQLQAMKEIVDRQSILAAGKSQQFERLGQLATFVAVCIPISTWIYAFFHANDASKATNIWPFIFSSTSLGFVAITVAVTFLRHSKTHGTESHGSQYYSDQLHKLRVALETDAPTQHEVTIELLAKYAKRGTAVADNEASTQSAEEFKNAFTFVSSLLTKT